MGRAISGKPRPLYLQPSHTGMVFSTTVDDGRPIRECDVSHYVFQIVNVRIKINEAVKEASKPGFFFHEKLRIRVFPPHHLFKCAATKILNKNQYFPYKPIIF